MRPDQELIQDVLDGNRKAFSEIVRKYQTHLLRVIVRFVKDLDAAEDVVQEAFFKAYQKLATFEGRSSFKSWLFQIAVNTAKNKLRATRKDSVSLQDVRLATSAEAEKDLTAMGIRGVLQEEIETLPEKQRLALTLRIYDDLSFKEIAEIMDCPYDTAKANYRHGLMKLRHRFSGNKDFREWAMTGTENPVEFRGYIMEADS